MHLEPPSEQSKSRLSEQHKLTIKVGKQDASIQILDTGFVAVQGYNYRVVNNTPEELNKHKQGSLFVDKDFTIDHTQQFDNKEIEVKRLSNLYGITNLPHFIDLKQRPTHLDSNQGVPPCVQELGLFDTLHYKSYFITQTFIDSGKYNLMANINGCYELITVDDRIPVYKDTFQPLWGLTFDNPWELILIKAWAKIKGGYHQILRSKPFEFVQTFTSSLWKYFNLSKEAQKFLKYYHQHNRFKNGKIILKSKSDPSINLDGFVPNSAGYEIIAINQDQRGRYVITVRSTDLMKYLEGPASFYRLQGQKYFKEGLTLDHDTNLTDTQFLKYFSSAYITATRHQDYFNDYKILTIQKRQRKAQHLQFQIAKEGFVDFSILQFPQNQMIQAGEQSKLFLSDVKSQISFKSAHEMGGKYNRFLKVKYILARDNSFTKYDNNENQNSRIVEKSRIRAVKGEQDYNLPRFTAYELEYFKGYNNGTAHFVKLDPGKYILRIKSELTEQQAKYSINWICSNHIEFKTSTLTVDEETDLLHHSMVSIMHRQPHFSYDSTKKTEMLSVANTFQEIGYGFFAIKCSERCARSILIEVDPKVLNDEGYRLKGKYKVHSDNKKKFAIKIESGEFDSIVFKKRKDAPSFVWPPSAFNIYKKQLAGGSRIKSVVNQQ